MCNGARRRSERGGGGGPAESAPRGESEASAASKRATARGARGVRRGGLLPGLQCMQYSVRIGSRGGPSSSKPADRVVSAVTSAEYIPPPAASQSQPAPPPRTHAGRARHARARLAPSSPPRVPPSTAPKRSVAGAGAALARPSPARVAEARQPPRPPPPLVLSGHAASLTPY